MDKIGTIQLPTDGKYDLPFRLQRRNRAFSEGCVSFCLAFLSLVAPIAAHASDATLPFKLNGSVRLRYEAINGQVRAGFDESDTLASIRTLILAKYNAGAVTVSAELIDSRSYGADHGTPLTTGEVNAVELVQAYVAVDINPLGNGTKLSLMVGRFMLNLGSRRLVAADDYRNTTNGYTGLRADIAAPGGIKATIYYTLPQRRRPDDATSLRDNAVQIDRESFDLVLWGGVVSKATAIGPATAELSYVHLGERDAPKRPTRDRSLDTFGARLITDPAAGKFDYEIEVIYQSGHLSRSLMSQASLQQVSASFLHADIGYSFAGRWKPHVSLEFDRASGDKIGGRDGRFDTLFGMRRAEFAPSGLFNSIGRANIATPGVRFEATPSKRLDWFAAYRAMWLASDADSFSTTGVRDPRGRSGDFAGHQVESRIRYWLLPYRLRFEVNALLLAKGHFLRDAPNAPPKRTTRYASFNLTASF
jgi:hypothetical protein